MSEQEQYQNDQFPTDPGPVFRRVGYLAAAVAVLVILSYFDVLGSLFGDSTPDARQDVVSESDGETGRSTREANPLLPIGRDR